MNFEFRKVNELFSNSLHLKCFLANTLLNVLGNGGWDVVMFLQCWGKDKS